MYVVSGPIALQSARPVEKNEKSPQDVAPVPQNPVVETAVKAVEERETDRPVTGVTATQNQELNSSIQVARLTDEDAVDPAIIVALSNNIPPVSVLDLPLDGTTGIELPPPPEETPEAQAEAKTQPPVNAAPATAEVEEETDTLPVFAEQEQSPVVQVKEEEAEEIKVASEKEEEKEEIDEDNSQLQQEVAQRQAVEAYGEQVVKVV